MVRSLLKLFTSLSFITSEFDAALGHVTAKHPQTESLSPQTETSVMLVTGTCL